MSPEQEKLLIVQRDLAMEIIQCQTTLDKAITAEAHYFYNFINEVLPESKEDAGKLLIQKDAFLKVAEFLRMSSWEKYKGQMTQEIAALVTKIDFLKELLKKLS